MAAVLGECTTTILTKDRRSRKTDSGEGSTAALRQSIEVKPVTQPLQNLYSSFSTGGWGALICPRGSSAAWRTLTKAFVETVAGASSVAFACLTLDELVAVVAQESTIGYDRPDLSRKLDSVLTLR
jgi:hypothetical protein